MHPGLQTGHGLDPRQWRYHGTILSEDLSARGRPRSADFRGTARAAGIFGTPESRPLRVGCELPRFCPASGHRTGRCSGAGHARFAIHWRCLRCAQAPVGGRFTSATRGRPARQSRSRRPAPAIENAGNTTPGALRPSHPLGQRKRSAGFIALACLSDSTTLVFVFHDRDPRASYLEIRSRGSACATLCLRRVRTSPFHVASGRRRRKARASHEPDHDKRSRLAPCGSSERLGLPGTGTRLAGGA